MIIYFTTLKQALQSHFHTITIEEFFYHFYFFKITFLLSLFKPLVNVPKMYRLQVIYINQLREAVSALPAEISIPWNALLPCLLNLLMSSTAIVFLLLIKTFVTFFLKTVLCSTASFTVTSVVSRMFFKMNKSKWWRTWWRFWRGRLLYLLIQEASCRCARLRAGIFLFRRTPQAVFPIKETCAARRTTQISLRHWTQFNRIRYISKKEELNAVLPFFVLYFVDFSYVFFCINDILFV